MKIYGATEMISRGQVRLIVAADSRARARQLLKAVGVSGITAHRMSLYWSESWNKVELSLATHEGVWFAPLDARNSKENFKEIVK